MIAVTWLTNVVFRFLAAPSCLTNSVSFLSFPTWYEFLPGVTDANGKCVPQLQGLSDVWLIVAALVEILLRVAAIAAVSMIVYGGFQYLMSNGNPDKASQAQTTVINALIGLVIAVGSSVVIMFIAGKF